MLDQKYITKAQTFLENPQEDKVITVDELKDAIDDGKHFFLLDVRMPDEVAEGKIPGVVNIPLPELDSRWSEVPKDKNIITVCARGGRAAAAMFILQDKGYNKIHTLLGGTLGWIQEGNKVE